MTGEQSSGDEDSLSWDSGGRRERRRRLSRSDVHHLLASTRRRAILSYLQRQPDQPVEFDELVEACLNDDARMEGKRAGRLQVEADLHHVQLPALDDAGVVRYDPDEGTVEYDRAKRLEAQLLASNAIDETDLDEQ